MIVVTVELWPSNGGKPRHLGSAVIINDGTGTLSSGNYKATFSRRGQGYPSFVQLAKRTHHVWRTGEVKNFPRKRLLAWDLLHRALTSALGSRAVVER